MRLRIIKPSFFKNEDLVQLPVEARLLFIGLWCLADRAGRLEDRPARIKMEVFPCDAFDINALLDHLQAMNFIRRYEVDGARYIQILNFEKHQRPHPREGVSTIPPCTDLGMTQATPRHDPGHAKAMASPSYSSVVSFPSVPSVVTALSPPPKSAGAPTHGFERIWERYPSKTGRKAAERLYKASVKTIADYLDLQKALETYLRSERVKNGYIQNGSTWFNNWRDWIDYTEVRNGHDDGARARGGLFERLRAENAAKAQNGGEGAGVSTGAILHGVGIDADSKRLERE